VGLRTASGLQALKAEHSGEIREGAVQVRG